MTYQSVEERNWKEREAGAHGIVILMLVKNGKRCFLNLALSSETGFNVTLRFGSATIDVCSE